MDWTMDWVATHFIQSHLFTVHHWSLACNFTGKLVAIPLALWHYVTRQFKLRVPDKTSATKSRQNYSNRLTKSKHRTALLSKLASALVSSCQVATLWSIGRSEL